MLFIWPFVAESLSSAVRNEAVKKIPEPPRVWLKRVHNFMNGQYRSHNQIQPPTVPSRTIPQMNGKSLDQRLEPR